MQVKICGLYRTEDIESVNKYRPDYCGFVVNVPKSHRNVDITTLRALRAQLTHDMMAVGVFVDAPVTQVAALLGDNTLQIAQLHGSENAAYITALRGLTDKPIWQAFQMKDASDIARAEASTADFILLDAGAGGGIAFDWSLLTAVNRPFALAGGLNIHNIPAALTTGAAVLDVSSGAETDRKKDAQKIQKIVNMIKGE